MRGGYSSSTRATASTDFTGQIGEQSWRLAQRVPHAGAREPRPAAAADARHQPPHAGGFPGHAGLPVHGSGRPATSRSSARICVVPLRRNVAGRRPRGRSAERCRSRRATSARARGGNWRTNNYNELNIIENGFLDEFRLAHGQPAGEQRRRAARAPARSPTSGPGTGTSPLPIFLAYFSGVGRDRRRRRRRSTRPPTSAAHVPDPARALQSAIRTRPSTRSTPTPRRRTRAIAAGLPSNFILVNPDLLGGANIVENDTSTMYQLDGARVPAPGGERAVVRRQLRLRHTRRSRSSSRCASTARWSGTTAPKVMSRTRSRSTSSTSCRSARASASGATSRLRLNRIIGGWQLAGNARVQSGQLVDLGNVRLVGMDQDELRGHVQAADRRAEPGVDAAAGHHRRERQGVQRQRDLGDAATARSGRRAAATSRRPTASTASRPIRGEGDCGLQSRGRHWTDVQAVRHQHRQAGRPVVEQRTRSSASTC